MRYNKFKLRKKNDKDENNKEEKVFLDKAARIYSAWANTYRWDKKGIMRWWN